MALDVVEVTTFALEIAGIVHGPTDPLHQLAGEMVRAEIGDRDPLPIDHGAPARVRGIGHYEYLRHVPFPLIVGCERAL
jgi:hypothetical protein